MKKIQIAIAAAALVMAAQARASLFDITFESNDGLVYGSGELIGTPQGGDLYEATAGSFTISLAGDGFQPGTYNIFNNSQFPNQDYSPSGYFIYDDQVLNGENPFVTNPGLLFTGPNGAQTLLELNLYSNGASQPVPNGTYQLYENNGANAYGNATLTAVPEASTMLAGALMLLPLGVSAVRIMRKNVVA